MPPKVKITKEEIIAAAVALVREYGIDALNARALAKLLNCSTQPIFSNYASMEELKADVMVRANEIYQRYISDGMTDPKCPTYKGSGLAYIDFARKERELFKLLFMRDRSDEEIREERESIADILQVISKNTGLGPDDAYMFHIEMWVYAHGIAVMIATSYLDWDEALIGRMMTDAYEGMKLRYAGYSLIYGGCSAMGQ